MNSEGNGVKEGGIIIQKQNISINYSCESPVYRY
jgi:hypothetical protein